MTNLMFNQNNYSRRLWTLNLVVVLSLAISPPVLAEASHFELQYMFMEADLDDANFEPDAVLYKHIIPYNSFINLEGIVAIGVTKEKEYRKTGVAGTYTQKLILSNMLGIMANISGHLEPKVHAYVHFGLVRMDYDLSTPSWVVGGPNGSQSQTGLAYGFGLSLHVLEKGAFIVEYNEFPDVDVGNKSIKTTALSVGYQVPF